MDATGRDLWPDKVDQDQLAESENLQAGDGMRDVCRASRNTRDARSKEMAGGMGGQSIRERTEDCITSSRRF